MAIAFIPQSQDESALTRQVNLQNRFLIEAVIEGLISLLDRLDGDCDFEKDTSDFEDNGDCEPFLGWLEQINQIDAAYTAKEPYQLLNGQNPNMVISRLCDAPALEKYKGVFL